MDARLILMYVAMIFSNNSPNLVTICMAQAMDQILSSIQNLEKALPLEPLPSQSHLLMTQHSAFSVTLPLRLFWEVVLLDPPSLNMEVRHSG